MCTSRIAALLAALAVALPAHADTVASLLGNFSINQFTGLRVSDRAIDIRYAVVLGQLPALRELHAADTDRDGVTTQVERDVYAQRLAQEIVGNLVVTEDGRPVALRATSWTTSLPNEQSGFSLRLDVDVTGTLDGGRPRTITFANGNYSRHFGWQEIVVTPAPGIAVYDADAFSSSLTDGLTESVRELPASGPLAERSARFTFRAGTVPRGSAAIAPRPGTAARVADNDDNAGWLSAQTKRVVDLIATPTVAPGVAALALLAAMLLGALHSFAPGHGKTVVGAYLIGSRATARHAAFLGLTVTVTHTLGVFALGFATLFASAYVLPERIFPVLGFASGLIVLGMGVVLAVQRWPAAKEAMHHERAGPSQARIAPPPGAASSGLLRAWGHTKSSHTFRSVATGGGFTMGRVQHAHAAAGWHSHGGKWHTHMPPGAAGEPVTWRGLLALGVSGGLVPCPSAMVLLLAAVALNKTAFGLALVVAFSAGLALTLMAIGLAFLYARNRFPTGARAPRWTRIVPLASAAAIVLIGALLCHAALTGGPI